MSTEITVTCPYIKDICTHLKRFIPKGDNALNLSISVYNHKLYFSCKSYIMYRAYVGTVNSDDLSLTVRYFDLLPFIRAEEDLSLYVDVDYVTISTTSFSCSLVKSYDVSDIEFDDQDFTKIMPFSNKGVFTSLKSFLNSTTLFNIYKKEHPYYIYDGVIVLKTPSVWLQGRCTSLNLNLTVTADVLRILTVLEPDEYYIKDNMLYVMSSYYMCSLPVQPIIEENKFVELIPKVQAVRFNTTVMLEAVTAIQSMKPQYILFNIFTNGVSIQATLSNCKINRTVGECTDLVASCRLPVELLTLAFKMLGNYTDVEALYEDKTLCLRNQNLIMLLRVLQ